MKPANIKGANKDAKIYVRSSTTPHNLLFCVHTLCMNYVTSTFLLVSWVVLGVRLPKMSRATAHTVSTVVVPMVPAGAV